MLKPFSLQPLLNLAQYQNESATRKLGFLNKQQQTEQQKLDTLLEYRKDYQSRLQSASQSGMDQAKLRNFQLFINKLDEAINQQTSLVEHSKVSTNVGRSEFNTTQRKLKSFDTLQQRHFEAQNKITIKDEQKIQDEHTGRRVAHKIINAEN